MEERLQKIMANAGVASRRKCEQLILDGKVEVNGEVVTALGVKADPATDIITVNGKPITANANKGRKTVLDFVKGIGARVYPVGRLDYDTEGLLLLTNDGDLANMLMHPRHHVAKTYHATVKGIPHGDVLDKLREGIQLDDGMTQPAEVEYHDVDMERQSATISITIYEGRNRQVRRMFEAIGHPVVKLKRVQFGSIFLQGIPRGKFRHLTQSEVNELKMAIKANRTEA